jgi:hypothetical protein
MLATHLVHSCLQAMIATTDLHSGAEAAQRIVPAVAPLAADPIEDVRAHALAALDCFVKQLHAEHRKQSEAAREAGDASKGAPGGSGSRLCSPGAP